MRSVDFEGAKRYALDRLRTGLPSSYTYHSLLHTRDDVVPAAHRLAELEGISGQDLILLLTAAYFHDIGFTKVYSGHEAAGAGIAEQALPEFGYTPEQIQTICSMIMATRLPQSPTTLLEEILADADLDVLGREDFIKRGNDLRAEQNAIGVPSTDLQWYQGQLRFISQHEYFTPAACGLRSPMQRENARLLKNLLSRSQPETGNKSEQETDENTGNTNKLPDSQKLAALESADFFHEIPAEIIRQAIPHLEELDFNAGETILAKGDLGLSMYILTSGRVRVHDAGRTIALLEALDVFGEMAALDPEPRSASLAAVEDTHLLRLSQKSLYDLLEKHSSMAQGIIRTLVQRLRANLPDKAESFQSKKALQVAEINDYKYFENQRLRARRPRPTRAPNKDRSSQ